MELVSSAFNHGETIPIKYTCEGENINPPLNFLNVPTNVKSLALLMWDPDVPTAVRPDNNFDHWVIYNIPPATIGLAESTKPPGQEGLNTRGTQEYRGPCPPDQEHRYFFKLLALSIELPREVPLDRPTVLKLSQDSIMAEAELMGKYNKQSNL